MKIRDKLLFREDYRGVYENYEKSNRIKGGFGGFVKS